LVDDNPPRFGSFERGKSTTIYQSDIDGLPSEVQERFNRLKRYDEGKSANNYGDRKRQRKIEREQRFAAIADELELTPYQKEQVQLALSLLDLRRLGYSMDLVAFCLCALVVRKDNRMYYPSRKDENNDPLFLEFARTLPEKDQRLIDRVIHKLRHRLHDGFTRQFDW
jgi:hypothetical protein